MNKEFKDITSSESAKEIGIKQIKMSPDLWYELASGAITVAVAIREMGKPTDKNVSMVEVIDNFVSSISTQMQVQLDNSVEDHRDLLHKRFDIAVSVEEWRGVRTILGSFYKRMLHEVLSSSLTEKERNEALSSIAIVTDAISAIESQVSQ